MILEVAQMCADFELKEILHVLYPAVVVIWVIHRAWLTHWGRMTHICVSKLNTIGSDNGLSPDRRQAII